MSTSGLATKRTRRSSASGWETGSRSPKPTGRCSTHSLPCAASMTGWGTPHSSRRSARSALTLPASTRDGASRSCLRRARRSDWTVRWRMPHARGGRGMRRTSCSQLTHSSAATHLWRRSASAMRCSGRGSWCGQSTIPTSIYPRTLRVSSKWRVSTESPFNTARRGVATTGPLIPATGRWTWRWDGRSSTPIPHSRPRASRTSRASAAWLRPSRRNGEVGSAQDFVEELKQRVPGAAVSRLVVEQPGRAVVGMGIGEGVHGVAVGMDLPVGTRGRELFREAEHILGRREGILVAVEDEHSRADLAGGRQAGRLEKSMYADDAPHIGAAASQIQRAHSAEAVSQGGSAACVDFRKALHRSERRSDAQRKERAILDDRRNEGGTLRTGGTALTLAEHVEREGRKAVPGETPRLALDELAATVPFVCDQQRR